METVFETVALMSLKASFVMLLVLLGRLILKKAPRKYSYLLWSVVLFRMICPFSLPMSFGVPDIPASIANFSANYSGSEIIPDNEMPSADSTASDTQNLFSNTGTATQVLIPDTENTPPLNSAAPLPEQEINYPLILSYLWLAGFILLFAYSGFSYFRLRRSLRTAIVWDKNIYESGNIKTAFVIGLLRAKIYIPAGLSDDERSYVIEHEKTHIRNADNIIKLLSFAALALHWFNPLMWIAFSLMSKDMEMKCDEAVVRSLGDKVRLPYGRTILALAQKNSLAVSLPPAFGESNTKQRVKNIMKNKKTTIISIVSALVVCSGIIFFGIADKQTELKNDPVLAADNEEKTKENIANIQETTTIIPTENKMSDKQNDITTSANAESENKKQNTTTPIDVKAIEELLPNLSGAGTIAQTLNEYFDGNSKLASQFDSKLLKNMEYFYNLSSDGEIDWNKLSHNDLTCILYDILFNFSGIEIEKSSDGTHYGTKAHYETAKEELNGLLNNGLYVSSLKELNENIKKIYGKKLPDLTKDMLVAAVNTPKPYSDSPEFKFLDSINGIVMILPGICRDTGGYLPYKINKNNSVYTIELIVFDDAYLDFLYTADTEVIKILENRFNEISTYYEHFIKAKNEFSKKMEQFNEFKEQLVNNHKENENLETIREAEMQLNELKEQLYEGERQLLEQMKNLDIGLEEIKGFVQSISKMQIKLGENTDGSLYFISKTNTK